MIPAERAHVLVAASTHPGMSGKNNEDRYGVSAFQLEDSERTRSLFAVVADGIGGHRAGEVASELAIETISRIVAAGDGLRPIETLHQAIVQAGEAIYAAAEAHPDQRGMGSTCACAWIIGEHLYIASVGDSRIYLRRANQIHQLTTDHTWVQDAIEQGIIRPDQARSHPNAHIIRRYLGSREQVEPDFRVAIQRNQKNDFVDSNQGLQLLPGDVILLCSDGLTDLVDDHEILALLKPADLEDALQELIDLANQRGGHDNITLIALRVPTPAPNTVPLEERQPRRNSLRTCLGIAMVVVLIAAALSGGYVFSRLWPGVRPDPAVQPLITGTLERIPAVETIPATWTTPISTATAEPQLPTPILSATTRTQSPISSQGTLTPWPTNTAIP